jgi:hypothetical protein
VGLGTPTTVQISGPTAGTLLVQCTTDEQHAIQVDTTDFPVETGDNVTDHKRRKPDTITLTGTITNAPLDMTGGTEQLQQQGFTFTVNRQPNGAASNASTAYDKFNEFADTPDLLTVTTELKEYTGMVLTNLTIPRNVKVGDSFEFTASFKNIRADIPQTVLKGVFDQTGATQRGGGIIGPHPPGGFPAPGG